MTVRGAWVRGGAVVARASVVVRAWRLHAWVRGLRATAQLGFGSFQLLRMPVAPLCVGRRARARALTTDRCGPAGGAARARRTDGAANKLEAFGVCSVGGPQRGGKVW